MSTFDTDEFGKGIEGLLGRAVDALTKGREELLKQSRIGKVKLIDLTQLRRERARLVQRLGEEAYRGLQAGSLDAEDLDRTYKKIVAMDEEIAAKEAEIEKIRREEEGATAKPSGSTKSSAKPTGKTGKSKAAKPAPKKGRVVDEEEDEDLDEDDDSDE